MIDLYELRQLTAFADLGTLSKVAEEFHISTPSVTRSMQHLEDAFGVPLFIRGKNRIELNDTGNTAVEYARKLLAEVEQAVAQAQEKEKLQRQIAQLKAKMKKEKNLGKQMELRREILKLEGEL